MPSKTILMGGPWVKAPIYKFLRVLSYFAFGGGQGGIRTLDTLAGMPPFQGGAFNHSATCPESLPGSNLAVRQRRINVSCEL
jgi:hypothetical protein